MCGLSAIHRKEVRRIEYGRWRVESGRGALKVAGVRGTGWGTSREGGKAVGHGLTAGARHRGRSMCWNMSECVEGGCGTSRGGVVCG